MMYGRTCVDASSLPKQEVLRIHDVRSCFACAQCGFGLLEAGTVQVKNVKNILLKNLLDACVGAILWFSLGHGIAYDGSGSFIGDAGAPVWWPAFCGGVDVVLGLGLLAAYILSSRRLPSQDR